MAAQTPSRQPSTAPPRLHHVLSARARPHPSQERAPLACDPAFSASMLKFVLEGDQQATSLSGETYSRPTGMVRVHDRNAEDEQQAATSDDSELVESSHLMRWRVELEKARKSGGSVVQVITRPGLSDLQQLEASIAADLGVPIVPVDLTNVRGALLEYVALQRPEVQALMGQAEEIAASHAEDAARGRRRRHRGPLSRAELEAQVRAKDEELMAKEQTIRKQGEAMAAQQREIAELKHELLSQLAACRSPEASVVSPPIPPSRAMHNMIVDSPETGEREAVPWRGRD